MEEHTTHEEVHKDNAVMPKPETSSVASQQHRISHRRIIMTIVVALLLFSGLGAYVGYRLSGFANQQASLAQHQSVANDGNKIVTPQEASISGVVDKVAPSVVSIVTQTQGSMLRGTSVESGAGTGIIVSQNGYIMTNKHVVEGADTVSVVLTDGTSYDNVHVVGADPLNDIAFLKIDNVSNLHAAELGDSSSLRIGQSVVAIGNSLGQYQNTVTSGIVSGVGRPVSAQSGSAVESLNDLIQTDAAINPGNSGGPLLNLQGQVIGMNTAVAQDAQGIGFALPINATKGVLKGVLNKGKVEHVFMGVNYVTLTPDAAKHYGITTTQGAYVVANGGAAVRAGSPADKAGVKEKDIITKVGSIDVGPGSDVASLVAEYTPGDTIQLTILRGSQTLTVNVTLVAYNG
jgi:serine protease Do